MFLVVAVAGAIGTDLGKSFVARYFTSYTPKDVLDDDWDRYSFETTHFSLLSPCLPKIKQITIPKEIMSKISRVENYSCGEYTFQISITSVVYQDGIVTDAHRAVDSMVAALRGLDGVTNFTHSTTPVMRSGRHGLLFHGTYNRKRSQITFKGIILAENSRGWQIGIFYPSGDNIAAQVAQKVIVSIQIGNI